MELDPQNRSLFKQHKSKLPWDVLSPSPLSSPAFAFMLLTASIGMFSPGNINTIDYVAGKPWFSLPNLVLGNTMSIFF